MKYLKRFFIYFVLYLIPQHGVFSTDTDDYFVEPLWNHTNVIGVEGHPHVVYSRSSLKLGDISSHCGVKGLCLKFID